MTSAVLLFLGLSALAGAHAQEVTSASIALIPELATLPFSGEIAGVGADGTTYVLSASGTEPGDIPFTMTVVQDATRVSQGFSLATGLGANAQCTYDSQGVGACTVVAEGAGTGTDTDAPPQTAVFSATIPLVAVPVTTASGTSSSAGSASGSGSATSSPSADASDDSSGAVRSVMAVSLSSIFFILLAGLVNV